MKVRDIFWFRTNPRIITDRDTRTTILKSGWIISAVGFKRVGTSSNWYTRLTTKLCVYAHRRDTFERDYLDWRKKYED